MKQKLKNLGLRLWKDESGQGTAEYALIVVAVVAFAIMFRSKISAALKGFIEDNVQEKGLDKFTVQWD